MNTLSTTDQTDTRVLKPIELLWAKSNPFRTLRNHMIDTGVCAKCYLEAISSQSISKSLAKLWACDDSTAVNRASYICSIHDIGKVHPDFQCKDPLLLNQWQHHGYDHLFSGRLDPAFRHEAYGAVVLKKILLDRGYDARSADCYSGIISLHHQGHIHTNTSNHCAKMWEDLQIELESEMHHIFMPDTDLKKASHWDSLCMILTGILIICDWVVSSDEYIRRASSANNLDELCYVSTRVLTDYGLISTALFPDVTDFRQMWPNIINPRPLQKACTDLDFHAPLTIIEAPMGEGKTETALYIAGKLCASYSKRGIYMALPTQATSNQMVNRVSEMLMLYGDNHARLLHGLAWMAENSEFEESVKRTEDTDDAADWLKPLRLGLLGRNAVGTVDQAMSSVLRIKYSMLRLIGLSNKVLIIDEIHAYDMYMGQIISRMLDWCCALSIPVILVSATMQSSQKRKYLSCFGIPSDTSLSYSYPLITQVDHNNMLRESPVSSGFSTSYRFSTMPKLGDTEYIAKHASALVANGGCICVMLNTVHQAQQVYTELIKLVPDNVKTLLFHARYQVKNRKVAEENCIKWFGKGVASSRPAKAILVCTQVVEQSLDVDFDYMISEIAPIDLLLQRAGRIHRHRNNMRPSGMESPTIEVLIPEPNSSSDARRRYGTTGVIYDPFLLTNTETLLSNLDVIRIPEDMRHAIEKCYENIDEKNMAEYIRLQAGNSFLKSEAESVIYSKPNPKLFFPVQSHTRFELDEIDDGFEPSPRASTRLGDKTYRVAFADHSLHAAAVSDAVSNDTARAVIENSVSLRLPHFNPAKDAVSSNVSFIQKGFLKGCILANGSFCTLGQYTITVSDTLGVCVEEKT